MTNPSGAEPNTAAEHPPVVWQTIKEYKEILFTFYDGIAKITINRPEKHNAFTPLTVQEMIDAMFICREDPRIKVIVLTGEGDKAFCSGGDQSVRGVGGYVGTDQVPRLNVLDLQKLIRSIPKVVIAMVAGWAIGGGHVLHVVCDLTIAADNARFGQTGPKVGSFDGGFGASYLARIVGQKKAREIWFLCDQYDAQEALDMGLVNKVVPLAELETHHHRLVSQDHGQKPPGHPHAEGILQRRIGRAGGHPGAGGQCHAALLPHTRGAGREKCVPGEAGAGMGSVSQVSVKSTAFRSAPADQTPAHAHTPA